MRSGRFRGIDVEALRKAELSWRPHRWTSGCVSRRVMSQSHKLRPSDISQELIDAEISESVMSEPDLLLLFGEKAVLEGYPPWQVRLTEIFALQDWTGGVGYHVFLRGLRRYGGAEMRFGR